MSVNAWFSGSRQNMERSLENIVKKALELLSETYSDLTMIESAIISGRLEDDLARLRDILSMLARSGISQAMAYTNRAELLTEYAKALRVRVLRLGTRGLSDARDEIIRNLNDIENFLRRIASSLNIDVK
ncbi:hypothetical protein PYJP_03170 [Pyrofollis japonicus]|uniref:hypothetical protein n=1 Tax=Pyrofollis japonicus TaxID=3060460 RepID=UPI00295C2A87|nr:hypothetical protein [Pyrofollis japonicus]BEP16965.1 hypothetical protein PYJP_03170 [Pyrofollis japonicus]